MFFYLMSFLQDKGLFGHLAGGLWTSQCSHGQGKYTVDGGVDGGESSYVSLVRSPATAPEKRLDGL